MLKNYEATKNGNRATEEARALCRYLTGTVLTPEEKRALQMSSDEAGGYATAPEQFARDLIKAIDDNVWIRGLARKRTVTQAQSLGIGVIETNMSDAIWNQETSLLTDDTALKLGKRVLRPHSLDKLLRVSNPLLRTLEGADEILLEILSDVLGVTEEKAFLNGSGAGRPLGVFTASDDGISTGRDVSTGNTTTSITFDGLTNAKYSLKGRYHRRARWIFHNDAALQISLLKDGSGQPIWKSPQRAGELPLLLDWPVMLSEFAPNTFTTGKYVGICGDFGFYNIADSLRVSIQVLRETRIENNQTEFIARTEVDGMPVLEEAFARVTLA